MSMSGAGVQGYTRDISAGRASASLFREAVRGESARPEAPGFKLRYRQGRQRLTTRRQLLELSGDELYDIGLSREQALTEARKSWWQS
jgi:uncharacterized protein YjiS (DUF1127 family)